MGQSKHQHDPVTERPRAVRLHVADNVVTVLEDCGPGEVDVVGEAGGQTLAVAEPVASEHKIATRPIARGGPVVKYGVVIGLAIVDIAPGAWVHTHNCHSRYDERSATLDHHTGAPTDIRYD